MKAEYQVSSAKYISDYVIALEFADGMRGEINLEKELWGKMFEPLRDKKIFSKVKVHKIFKTIFWPNGADLAPEFLRENLK